MNKQKQVENSNVVLVKPQMGYPDWFQFLDYVRSISAIAERLLWDRMKDIDGDELRAYKTTDEYRDLKRFVIIHAFPQTSPHNFVYRSLSYSDAFAELWKYIRDDMKATNMGIDMIQREYDKFSDAARQAGQGRTEQKQAIKAKLKRIGK